MALRAASPLAPFWYEPEGQAGEPTRFQIRGLTGLELAEVNTEAKPDFESKTVRFGAAAMRVALQYALLGWENFQAEDGGNLEFDAKNRIASIEKLPFDVIGELFGEILKASRVGADKQKN
jgi:hypothetical protein